MHTELFRKPTFNCYGTGQLLYELYETMTGNEINLLTMIRKVTMSNWKQVFYYRIIYNKQMQVVCYYTWQECCTVVVWSNKSYK
jgi:hypothetical protein